MASTFHTPSFGDEDFNLPPLTLAAADASAELYLPQGPAPPQKCTSVHVTTLNSIPQQHVVTSLSTPTSLQGHHHQQHQHHHQQQQQHHIEGQGQNFPQTFPNQHHHNGYHSVYHHQQQQQDHFHQDSTYGFLPKFPPQTFDIPDIQISNSLVGVGDNSCDNQHMNMKNHVMNQSNMVTNQHGSVMASSHPMLTHGMAHPGGDGTGQMMPPSLHTPVGHPNPQISPPGSNSTSPGRESSAEESSSDDSVPLSQLAQKRNAPTTTTQKKAPVAPAPKKPRTPKKRKKKDPNEPQKPVSAYALFFRDTQAAIKTRNPSASFGEVSKIVASMWDSLAEDHKNDYKKRTETAKKEYLKQLAAYRATLVSKGALEVNGDGNNGNHGNRANNSSPKQPTTQQKQQQQQQQHQHSSPSHQPILSNPAMTTVPMTTHHMTSSMSMPHMPPPHLANAGMIHNPGHMMPTPHQQNYGMPMSHNVGHMGGPPPPHMNMHPSGGLSPNAMVASPPEAMGMHDNYMNSQVLPSSPPMAMDSPSAASMCVRNGCANPAIPSPGWDNEYCSNDCVVNHCRDAFSQWVASRQGPSPYASVK